MVVVVRIAKDLAAVLVESRVGSERPLDFEDVFGWGQQRDVLLEVNRKKGEEAHR